MFFFPAAKISASIFRKHNIYINFLLTIQKPNLIMNKKDYQRPTTKVVQLRHAGMLMTSGVGAMRSGYGTASTDDGTEETWE